MHIFKGLSVCVWLVPGTGDTLFYHRHPLYSNDIVIIEPIEVEHDFVNQ